MTRLISIRVTDTFYARLTQAARRNGYGGRRHVHGLSAWWRRLLAAGLVLETSPESRVSTAASGAADGDPISHG